MKFPRAKIALVLCLLATGVLRSTPAYTQTPPVLPPLEVSPAVVPPDGNVTISLPPNFPLNNTRWRIGIWEHARPAFLGDVIKDFTVRDGGLRATVRIEADPGTYDLRLLTNDKRGAALTQPAQIIVPGIRREPGWWLMNGSPFVWRSQNTPAGATDAPTGAPLFIPGLKRNANAKAKDLTRNITVPASGLTQWRVLQVPGLSLQNLTKSGTDVAALRTQISDAIQQAQAKGDRNYLGIGVWADVRPENLTDAPAAMGRLRQVLNEVAPEAALILQVGGAEQETMNRTIDACAAQVDAMVVTTNSAPTWGIKAARRVAEEQPNYDLPIFVQREDYGIGGSLSGSQLTAGGREERELLDLWMGGVTGFVLHAGDSSFPKRDEAPRWAQLMQRNSPLFIGSVTLEDIGLLPWEVRAEPPPMYVILRAAHRIPLLARAGRSTPESFIAPLGENVTRETIGQLRTSATGGARIYVEGTPETENAEDAASLASVLGGTFKRSEREVEPAKPATMTLEDSWLFGLSRGRQITVGQRGEVTVNPGTISGQAKTEKGKDVLTGPRIVARLADGSPAVIINPVGKGEVVWLPHRIPVQALHAASVLRAATDEARVQNEAVRTYYAAIAAYLQPALVQVRGANDNSGSAENVRVALRSSSKGTLLVALMNTGANAVTVSATLNARAGVAIDLAEEKELALDTRGNHVTARVTIPANGWKLIAFGNTRKELDEERNAKRMAARLR